MNPSGGGDSNSGDSPLRRGHLYVVGTPIGNLGDMTFRAVETLRGADLIAAEDTRHTGRLLQHFAITTPQTSYHHHNWRQRVPELLAKLHRGQAIALVSDAGMPGISDPGFELVAACVAAGIPVVPIPGVTAAVTALCVSGLNPQPFSFEGFLPARGRDRREQIQRLTQDDRTLVLYEAPHRLLATLEDLAAALGPQRPVVLGRELTKQYEELWRGTLATAIAHYQTQPPRGEFTLVIGPAPPVVAPVCSEGELRDRLQALLDQGLSRSQASRTLAQETALPRRDLYRLALEVGDASEAAGDCPEGQGMGE